MSPDGNEHFEPALTELLVIVLSHLVGSTESGDNPLCVCDSSHTHVVIRSILNITILNRASLIATLTKQIYFLFPVLQLFP